MVLAVLLGQARECLPPQPGISLIVVQYLLPLLIGLAFYVLLAFCYRAAKYFGSAGREQKLLRMEMGKLAEEVQLLRRDLNGGKDSGSPNQTNGKTG